MHVVEHAGSAPAVVFVHGDDLEYLSLVAVSVPAAYLWKQSSGHGGLPWTKSRSDGFMLRPRRPTGVGKCADNFRSPPRHGAACFALHNKSAIGPQTTTVNQ